MSALKLLRAASAAVLAMSVMATPAFARGHHSHSGHHSAQSHHVHHSHHAHHTHRGHHVARHHYVPGHSSAVRQVQPNEAILLEHGSYRNSDGVSVHSPAHSVSGAVPDGASARCGDGTYSFSLHRRGTCAHHGGVSAWF